MSVAQPAVQNEHDVGKVLTFTYLGDTLNTRGNVEAAVRNRISAAWLKYRQLSSVLCRRDIPVLLRCKMYDSVIRSVMLYGSETWATTQNIENQLIRTDRKMLRWIHRLSLKDHIPSSDILIRSGLCDIKNILCRNRLRWFGHVKRSKNFLIQSIVEINVYGKRPRGRPQTSWWQCASKDMNTFGLVEEDAMDRAKWKC